MMMKQKYSFSLAATCALAALTAACGGGSGLSGQGTYGDPSKSYTFKQKPLKPYPIKGKWYYPAEDAGYDEVGIASWYGDYFHGRPTATGEIYNMNDMTAAHKTLPLPSWAVVTNLENGKEIYLKINDRGPFVDGRIIDLSRAAAQALGTYRKGLGRVRVRAAEPPKNVALITPSGKTIRGSGKGRPGTALAAPSSAGAPGKNLPLYQGGGRDTYSRETLMSGLKNGQNIGTPAFGVPSEVTVPADGSRIVTQAPVLGRQNAAPRYRAETFTGTNFDAPPQTASGKTYRVRVGAFSSRENARRLQEKISGLGNVRLDRVASPAGDLQRITLEGYDSYADASRAAEALKNHGVYDARVEAR